MQVIVRQGIHVADTIPKYFEPRQASNETIVGTFFWPKNTTECTLIVHDDCSVVGKLNEPKNGCRLNFVYPQASTVSLLCGYIVLDTLVYFRLVPPVLGLEMCFQCPLDEISKTMFQFKQFGIGGSHSVLGNDEIGFCIGYVLVCQFYSPCYRKSLSLVEIKATIERRLDIFAESGVYDFTRVDYLLNLFDCRCLRQARVFIGIGIAKLHCCWIEISRTIHHHQNRRACFNKSESPSTDEQRKVAPECAGGLLPLIGFRQRLCDDFSHPPHLFLPLFWVNNRVQDLSPLSPVGATDLTSTTLSWPIPSKAPTLGAKRRTVITPRNPDVAALFALVRCHFDFSHSNPLFNKVYIYSRHWVLTSQALSSILYIVSIQTMWGAEMDEREQRGMELAATKKMRQAKDGWIVPSQTGDGTLYKVNLEAQTCSCPDHETRQVKCKHIYAVEFTIRRETDTNGNVATTKTIRITYSQDWTAYNAAQTEEKERFTALLSDLCRLVSQPPQTTGRPRLPLSDMVFACAYKVYSGFSTRRFSSDMREAHEDGLVATTHHFNRVSSYLSDPVLTPLVKRLITVSSLPLKGIETDFAVDSSGFSTSRFVRWYNKKWGREIDNREWVKVHLMCGVNTHIVTAVDTSGWAANDTTFFRPLVEQTAQHFQIAEVSADKAYPSHQNLQLVNDLGATPFIPFKTNVVPPTGNDTWAKMYHYYMCNRDVFLQHYHKRSNVETVFSMVKGKFGDSVRSKTDVGQVNEVLMKVLCHNLCVLNQSIHELGIEATFSAGMPVARQVA